MSEIKPISTAMLGAGSWGLAVANLISKNSHPVKMWEFNKADYEQLKKNRELSETCAEVDVCSHPLAP